jgi:hypothetical protein
MALDPPRLPIRCSGSWNLDSRPGIDVALPVAVVSGCEDSSGRRGSDGVVAARGQRYRVFPPADVARSGRPVPGRKDPPVALRATVCRYPAATAVRSRQSSTAHCRRRMFPAASAEPSARTPAVCQSPQERATISRQDCTSHCPSELRPAASTVPFARSPSVRRQPAATAVTSRQAATSHWPSPFHPVASTVPSD